MFTTSRIFVDSSVLVEPLQNRKVEFYKDLILNHTFTCCINTIEVSEYLYKYIGLQNLGSPQTVQENKKTAEALQPYFITRTLEEFQLLEINSTVLSQVPELMSKYNLLPNDAIILATCKIHGIKQLASHDTDFEEACKTEGIELLTEKD
ncbi:type II toxin-antitoxin system VapC family toxin [Parafilimonas terrae]|uniref:Predicted nucleic acid-binding protein, contains PIN domain n=1 Tax=Parafilimonas terrae TaxID=1465490 RepID=A0A1I5RS59_9BACT|nr:type II toxin-antitoxin system VapC family toxin [Parafilimonas terrae]SFP61355.1 Predicted nucleic acid-binding protein, contains PIN domain [Parafilimonas terrae]